MSATKYIKAHYEARKTQPPQKDEEEKAKQLLTNLFRSVVDSKRRNHGVEHFHGGSEEVKQGDDVVDYRDMEVTKEELIDGFFSCFLYFWAACRGHGAGIASRANKAKQFRWKGLLTSSPVPAGAAALCFA